MERAEAPDHRPACTHDFTIGRAMASEHCHLSIRGGPDLEDLLHVRAGSRCDQRRSIRAGVMLGRFVVRAANGHPESRCGFDGCARVRTTTCTIAPLRDPVPPA